MYYCFVHNIMHREQYVNRNVIVSTFEIILEFEHLKTISM